MRALLATWTVTRDVLREKAFRRTALGVGAAFLLYAVLPAMLTPGDTIGLQLVIFTWEDYVLMAVLAGLTGLQAALAVSRLRAMRAADAAVTSAMSGAAGIVGALVGTASCASCLGPLLGILGLGAANAFFLLEYQRYVSVGAVVLMLVVLSVTARGTPTRCDHCEGASR